MGLYGCRWLGRTKLALFTSLPVCGFETVPQHLIGFCQVAYFNNFAEFLQGEMMWIQAFRNPPHPLRPDLQSSLLMVFYSPWGCSLKQMLEAVIWKAEWGWGVAWESMRGVAYYQVSLIDISRLNNSVS